VDDDDGEAEFPGGSVNTTNFPPGTVIVVSGGDPSVDYGDTASEVVTLTPTMQPEGEVELTFVVGELDGDTEQYCLASFDEERLVWECVDECLRRSGEGNTTQLTGSTPHFSTFAVLLGGNGCGVDSGIWIASVVCVGVAVLLALGCALLIRYNRRARDFFGGTEETRVRNLRREMALICSSEQPSSTALIPSATEVDNLT
jgi:hypothetical protein